MADIGSLVVQISADASGLVKAFDQMGGSASQFQRGMETVSKTISTAFFAATSAAIAMTIQAGRTAEETEQLAMKTGIAANSLEGMSVVMARNGLNAQSVALAVKGLSTQMVGVREGTASSIKLFQEMGVSLDVVGRGTGATLRAIADRFKELPDGANKAKLAVDLFGKAGLEWIPILNKGGVALDESMKKSAEFGLILSDTARTQLSAFDDALDDMQSALKGFGMQVGVAFAPAAIILVQAFTDVIVFTKNVFNQFSDAASTLSIRLGAMVASVQILAQNIFSLKAFSKAAWEETINHVKAIDAWATAEIHGVESARAAETELAALALKHLEASESVTKHTSSQKTLGEQIVATTKIQLQQIEEMGKQQERMGHDIVSNAKVTMQIDVDAGKEQERLGQTIHRNFAASQEVAQQWVDSYMVQEDAAMARFQAEIDAIDHNEEAQGRAIVAQSQAAQQVKGFWETQLDAVVASNAFSVSQIITTWTSGVANAIVTGGDFVKQAWQATQVAIIQGAINTTIAYGVQVARRALFDKAAAAGSLAVWGGAAKTAIATFASVAAALKTMFVSVLVPAVVAVGKFIAGVLTAIATAMKSTVFGIPLGIVILAGVAVLLAALAATGNLGFKEGGIGDFGSGTQATLHGPEAIIPLNSRGAAFMQDAFGAGGKGGGPVQITIMLDSRVLGQAMFDRFPSIWRANGLPG